MWLIQSYRLPPPAHPANLAGLSVGELPTVGLDHVCFQPRVHSEQ